MPLGDAPRLYQAVFELVRTAPWNDVRNAITFAWMITGLLLSAQVSVPGWLAHIISKANFAQSVERRVARWLHNHAIDPMALYRPLITRALRGWGPHRLTLALDTSMLFEHFCLIRVAVLWRGCAVPLVSQVIEHHSAQVSLAQLLPVLTEAQTLLERIGITDIRLLADRGFCDTKLMAWLTTAGWHYRIRIKSNLILSAPNKKRLGRINDVKLKPREMRCFHNVRLTGQRFGPVHVALGRPTDGPEQWQVVSDEPTGIETFDEYGERFGIEEGFLDDKSGLFGLEDSKLRDAQVLSRLVLVVSTATLFLVSEGVRAVHQGMRRQLDPHWQRGLSYLKIGLRALHAALSRGQRILGHLTLCGKPDPEPLGYRKKTPPPPSETLEPGWMLSFRLLS